MATAKETYSWLFVNTIPLLYEEKKNRAPEQNRKLAEPLSINKRIRHIDLRKPNWRKSSSKLCNLIQVRQACVTRLKFSKVRLFL